MVWLFELNIFSFAKLSGVAVDHDKPLVRGNEFDPPPKKSQFCETVLGSYYEDLVLP